MRRNGYGISSLYSNLKVTFWSRQLHYDQNNFVVQSLKWSRWWFLCMVKTVLLRLTECQMVLLWLLHTTKSLFIPYGTQKFENFVPKHWRRCANVAQWCMPICWATSWSSIYSSIKYGNHFIIHRIAPIWVSLTSTFFQN